MPPELGDLLSLLLLQPTVSADVGVADLIPQHQAQGDRGNTGAKGRNSLVPGHSGDIPPQSPAKGSAPGRWLLHPQYDKCTGDVD